MDDNTLDPNTPEQTPTITYIPSTEPSPQEDTIHVEMPRETTGLEDDAIADAEATALPEESAPLTTAPAYTETPMPETPFSPELSVNPAEEHAMPTSPVETLIMPVNDTEKTTKILKIAVPIIVILIVVVGGYLAYAKIFGESNSSIEQEATGDLPNFLNTTTDASEEIPSEYQDALEELMNTQTETPVETPTEATTETQTETQSASTTEPQAEELPKVKVPRT